MAIIGLLYNDCNVIVMYRSKPTCNIEATRNQGYYQWQYQGSIKLISLYDNSSLIFNRCSILLCSFSDCACLLIIVDIPFVIILLMPICISSLLVLIIKKICLNQDCVGGSKHKWLNSDGQSTLHWGFYIDKSENEN